MLLVTPYFLQELGEELYGHWVLINSIIASLGILNLGLGDATIKYISKYKVDDPKRTVKIANTSYSLYLLITIVALLVVYLYLFLEKSFPLFLSSSKNGFIDLLELGIVLFGVRLIEQVILSIYKGFERFDIFSKISILSKLTLVLTNILIVYLGYSLDTILVFSVISSSIFLGTEFILLKKFIPGFSVIPKLNKEILSEILKFGLWSWVQSIIGILGYQMDKFLVAGLAGVKVLAIYSIGFTVATQIFNVFVAGSNWIFPKVSRYYASRDDLTILYKKSQGILIAIASFSITGFYLIKDPILVLWLGEDIFTRASPYINAYCIFILFTSLTIIPSFFSLGTSNMKLMTVNSIMSLVLTGGCMFFLFNIYGPIGLVYGRILSSIFAVPTFLIMFYKLVLKSSYRYIALELLIPFLLSVFLITQSTLAAIVVVVLVMAVFVYILKTNFKYQQDLKPR